ncbi:MAG: hypothetical protein ACO1QR_11955 [Chthoniobacteraceae bacterium]
MRPLTHMYLAIVLATATPLDAQVPADSSPKFKVPVDMPDFWPGKYVKLPAGESRPPVKLTYVTITKAGDDYQIEGFGGRKFRASNMNRSLDEIDESPTDTTPKPLAQFALGTATLHQHGVVQIVIEALAGNERYYLVRAQPVE